MYLQPPAVRWLIVVTDRFIDDVGKCALTLNGCGLSYDLFHGDACALCDSIERVHSLNCRENLNAIRQRNSTLWQIDECLQDM